MDLAPEEQRLFMGQNIWATIVFALAILLAAAAVALVLLGIGSPKPGRMLIGAIAATILTLLGMVFLRAILRDAELRPFYDAAKTPVSPQWGALALFAILFAAALGLMAYLARLAVKAFPPPKDAPLGSGGYRFKIE